MLRRLFQRLFTKRASSLISKTRLRGSRFHNAKRNFLRFEPLEDRSLLAAITTDQPDYAPGSTALITASGFQVGESVQINITSDTPGPGQGAWTVTDGITDGSSADLDGLANGSITTSWLVDPDGAYIGATLLVTATGLASGDTSTSTFTDAGPSPNVGPITVNPSVFTNVPPKFTATATIGGNGITITSATYKIDNGPTLAMAPSDGSFNSNSEGLTATLSAAAFNALAEGSHTVLITATASNTNTGTGSTTFTKDTVAPTIVQNSPPDFAYVSGTITLDVSATDTNMSKVEFYQDTHLIGTDTNPNGGWNVTVNTNSLVEGRGYTWFAKAFDASGNNTTSQFRVFIVDNTRPTVVINKGGADPTNVSNLVGIGFNVIFSEPVTGFTAGDVALSGTAGPTTALVSDEGGGHYLVVVTGMTGDGTVIASIPANKTTDAAGNGNFASTSTDNSVLLDRTKPTITGSAAPAANANGWNNTDVTVTFTCTDATSGVASCSSPVTRSAEGTNQSATGTATDNAGNTASTTVSGINIDKTPPITSASLAGALGNNSWYTTPVLVTLSATDNLSGVAATHYSVDGGPALNYGGPFNVSGDGFHTVKFYSVDQAGNSETDPFVSFKIDTTAPAITGSSIPPPNANGWNNTDVSVSFTCSDATSGIASCSGPTTFSSEGANQSITGTAIDNAGNTASVTVSGINIDKTPPVTTAVLGGTMGANGWFTTPLTITMVATDYLSGVATTLYSLDGGPLQTYTVPFSVSGDGPHLLTFYSVDGAGNSEIPFSAPLKIDTTAPTITGSAAPVPNASGWNNTNVTVSFSCSDVTSGVASCSGPTTLSSDGASQSITGTAADNAGNTASATISGINIDKTAPVTTATLAGALGNNGWYTSAVTVTLAATDVLSGVANTYYTVDGGASQTYAAPFTVSGDGPHTVKFYSTDNADNAELDPTVSFKIDVTPPTLALSSSYTAGTWTNQDVTVSYLASDATSGLVDPASDSTTVTTEGDDQSVTFTVHDAAGNFTSQTFSPIRIDKTPPTITATRDVPANGFGWNNTNVPASYIASDGLSGLADPASGSYLFVAEGAGQSHTFTVIDLAGNSASATVSGINIDKTPPTIVATVTGTQGANNWFVSDVVVHYTCNDNLSGVNMPCPPDVTLSDEGPAVYAPPLTILDKADNEAQSTAITVMIDKHAPHTTASLSGTVGTNDWYKTPVTVALSASDNVSGVASTLYSVDGGPVQAYSGSFIVSGDGSHTVSFHSIDNAGNIEADSATSFKIDTTPPTIIGSRGPAANAYGWNNTDVTVTFACSDSTSGVAFCSGPTTLSVEGASQSVTGTATDNAGNPASATISGINIDKTAPTTGLQITGVHNATTYLVGSTFSWNSGDGLSGVASTSVVFDGGAPLGAPSGTIVLGTGVHAISVTTIDKAGNSSTKSLSVTVKPVLVADGNLYIVGTSGPDNVTTTATGTTVVVVGGPLPGTYSGITGHIVADLGDGNDSFSASGAISLEAHGGNGNDTITGGSGNDVIWGDAGDDTITGAAGDDVLIGGTGSDRLVGAAGNDILIAGDLTSAVGAHTGALGDGTYDYATLRAISTSWSAAQPADADLADNSDHDVVDAAFDQLTGSAGADWFIVDINDKITDLAKDLAKDGDKITYV